jgi:hypothetical protein
VLLASVIAAVSYRTVTANPTGTITGMDQAAAIKEKARAKSARRAPATTGQVSSGIFP